MASRDSNLNSAACPTSEKGLSALRFFSWRRRIEASEEFVSTLLPRLIQSDFSLLHKILCLRNTPFQVEVAKLILNTCTYAYTKFISRYVTLCVLSLFSSSFIASYAYVLFRCTMWSTSGHHVYPCCLSLSVHAALMTTAVSQVYHSLAGTGGFTG